jgi:hypothetical protein
LPPRGGSHFGWRNSGRIPGPLDPQILEGMGFVLNMSGELEVLKGQHESFYSGAYARNCENLKIDQDNSRKEYKSIKNALAKIRKFLFASSRLIPEDRILIKAE